MDVKLTLTKAIMALLHLCLYSSHNQIFVIPGLAMSKIYAITMLVILNNRLKIEGGRFYQGEEEEEEEVTLNSENPRRHSRTNIIVSNGRLTFQLGDVLPARRNNENNPSHDHDSVLQMEVVCCHILKHLTLYIKMNIRRGNLK